MAQVRETQSSVRDGRTGQHAMTISRGLGDKVIAGVDCVTMYCVPGEAGAVWHDMRGVATPLTCYRCDTPAGAHTNTTA
jgi:hypothetical protein